MPDTPKYYAVLTEAGAALEARALAEGRGIILTHIAIGDANLEEVTPNPAVTELVHEVHRRPIDAKSLDEDDPKITLLHAVIPASEGGFWIRELGVIGRLEDAEDEADNPDVLYAYANHAPYYKMLPQDGQTVTHELTVPIAQASNARLIIQVSDEGYATRRQFQDLNERVGALEGELSGDTGGENSGIVARVDEAEARLEELEANFPIPLPEFNDTITLDDEEKYGVPALEGGIKFCTFKNFGLKNGSSSNYKSPTFSGSNIEIMGGNPVHVSQVNSARLVVDEPGLYFISFRGDIIWSGSNTYTGNTQIIIRKS